ncbi:unnamed protein product [Ixodes hexagonus]
MALIAALVVVLCLNQALSKDFPKPEHCDVPFKDQLEQRLNKVFRKLPKEYLFSGMKTELIPGTLYLGESTVLRLDEFKPDRPYQTFCRGSDTITLFSIRSKYPLRMMIPWSLFSGHNGTLVTSVDSVRFEGELVTTVTPSGPNSKIENLVAAVMESVNVGMRGDGGETLHLIAHVIGGIVSRPFRVLWTMVATHTVEETLNTILNEVN